MGIVTGIDGTQIKGKKGLYDLPRQGLGLNYSSYTGKSY
jgi:hypothetical protein